MNAATDPCHGIDTLNLSVDGDCETILKRDKHARLEGLCAELLFYEELIRPSFTECSVGWWIAPHGNTYKVAHIIEEGHVISSLDEDIYRHFVRNHTRAVRLTFNAFRKSLLREQIALREMDDVLYSRRSGQQPHTDSPPKLSNSTERNVERANKAIAFLRDRGALRPSAIARLVANCFVHARALWDIDAIVRYGDRLVAFEAKQKYPSRKGAMGINQGLSNVFRFLNSSGMQVVHVVLTKPVWDTETSAIDFMTADKYSDKSLWIASDSSNIGRRGRTTSAPARTSFDGSTKLMTDDIEITDFHHVGIQGRPIGRGLLEFLEGKARSLLNVEEIPKVG